MIGSPRERHADALRDRLARLRAEIARLQHDQQAVRRELEIEAGHVAHEIAALEAPVDSNNRKQFRA